MKSNVGPPWILFGALETLHGPFLQVSSRPESSDRLKILNRVCPTIFRLANTYLFESCLYFETTATLEHWSQSTVHYCLPFGKGSTAPNFQCLYLTNASVFPPARRVFLIQLLLTWMNIQLFEKSPKNAEKHSMEPKAQRQY